jgi:thiamine-monophosphate kinase
LGEDQLVAELTRGLARGSKVRVGIGDDCAVIGRPRDEVWTLLKADAVVEGVHFREGENWERAGWKAICRAISDIAAMGGIPEYALVTLALPVETTVARAKAFYRGLKRAGKRFGVEIVGGETSRSPGPLFCSIALAGRVERTRCVLRSGGQAGDAIYVTGRLGGSLRTGKHFDFVPRLEEARWLGGAFRLHAMMDLSDGLAADLPRLAAASGCGFEIWENQIPKTRGCSIREALGDGEDFELLFCLAPTDGPKLEAAWKRQFPRIPLTRIGVLRPRTRRKQVMKSAHGFDHFA